MKICANPSLKKDWRIRQNLFAIRFLSPLLEEKKTSSNLLQTLKSDVQYYSRLFTVCASRYLDLIVFFERENQDFPASISLNGLLRPGTKHNLVGILEKYVAAKILPRKCDAVVIDGAVLVHNVKPRPDSASYQSYVAKLLSSIGYLRIQHGVKRIDIAWDLPSLPCATYP